MMITSLKILGTSFACSSKNGKLYQRPISELRNYFANKVNYNGVIKGESVTIKGIEGRQIDLDIKLLGGDFESFVIDFGVSDSTYTRFLYNKNKEHLKWIEPIQV